MVQKHINSLWYYIKYNALGQIDIDTILKTEGKGAKILTLPSLFIFYDYQIQ